MATRLISYFPEHKTYVEVFGGGGSVLFAKEPSLADIYNDIDSTLVSFFRVLRDEEQFKEFHKLVELTPYSREEFYFCRDHWKDTQDMVTRVFRWFVVARMSFAGEVGGSWSHSVTTSRRGMSKAVSAWLSIVEMLPEIHERLSKVQIEHQDFRSLIKAYDRVQTFFYCDPPYLLETRRSGGYDHEMSDADHIDLLTILKQVKGMVLISGYPSELYSKILDGWDYKEWDRVCSAAGNTVGTGILGEGSGKEKQSRIEAVWANYTLPKD